VESVEGGLWDASIDCQDDRAEDVVDDSRTAAKEASLETSSRPGFCHKRFDCVTAASAKAADKAAWIDVSAPIDPQKAPVYQGNAAIKLEFRD